MNKTAKILIASAFAVAVGFASAESWTNVAKTPATVAHQVGPHVNFTSAAPVPVRPPAPVQPTEWWQRFDFFGTAACERSGDSPAKEYELLKAGMSLLQLQGRTPVGELKIFDGGGSRVDVGLVGDNVHYEFYRTQEACERAIKTATEATEAEQRKLAPYR